MTQDTVDKLNGFGKLILTIVAIVGMIATFSVGFNQIGENNKANSEVKVMADKNNEFRISAEVRLSQIESGVREIKGDVKELLSR